MSRCPHPLPIGVIGAGFTGTVLALQLAQRGVPVHLVEPRPPGPGLAYGTEDPLHLLNVPAKSMSAFPDEPTHFLDWVTRQPSGGSARSARRRDRTPSCRARCMAATCANCSGVASGITHHAVAAEDVVPQGGGYVIAPLGLVVRAVALCLGNPPPRAGEAAPGVVNDPWAPGGLDGLDADAAVAILGTGLTMADMVMTLRLRHGHRGTIHAVSRHGWLPLPHAEPLPAPRPAPALGGSVSAMMRSIRAASAALPWQAGVDGFRGQLQPIWRAMDPTARARFLRHARTPWNLHRHRLPPLVAARLAAEAEAGTLRLHAGRLAGYAEGEMTLHPRGGGAARRVPAQRLAPLYRSRPRRRSGRAAIGPCPAGRGLLCQDGLSLGLEVEPDRLEAAPGLHVLGPPTRAALWEATAVPELRVQAARVAELLA
jgi:uncharacterized NAD(P)/FAD-binding protein YdhS